MIRTVDTAIGVNGTRAHALDRGGNQSSVRTANLALVMGLLRVGPRSRAELAKTARLSKSATSSIVADLLSRGLVSEGRMQRQGHVGRPGLRVHVSESIATLGVEITADHLTAVALDLTGAVRLERQIQLRDHRTAPADTSGHDVLAPLADLVRASLRALRRQGLQVPRVVVAAPGVIMRGSGVVHLSASLGWHDVDVASSLRGALGPRGPHVRVENDARLHAVAEFAPYARDGITDMVCLTGDVGVGGGIIAGGRPVAGFAGLAGEVGHLPLGDPSRPCRCGRSGCWENEVGLDAFLGRATLPGDPARAHDAPLSARLEDLGARLRDGDARVAAAVEYISVHLFRGVSVLVDVLNPQIVVLGGYFATISEALIPRVRARLDEIDIRGQAGRPRIVASRLGLTSAAVGAATLALDEVYADPGALPVVPDLVAHRSDDPTP